MCFENCKNGAVSVELFIFLVVFIFFQLSIRLQLHTETKRSILNHSISFYIVHDRSLCVCICQGLIFQRLLRPLLLWSRHQQKGRKRVNKNWSTKRNHKRKHNFSIVLWFWGAAQMRMIFAVGRNVKICFMCLCFPFFWLLFSPVHSIHRGRGKILKRIVNFLLFCFCCH